MVNSRLFYICLANIHANRAEVLTRRGETMLLPLTFTKAHEVYIALCPYRGNAVVSKGEKKAVSWVGLLDGKGID